MAKNSKSSKLSGERIVPGCWWGILHSFDIQEHLHLRRFIGHRRSINGSGAEVSGINFEKVGAQMSIESGEDHPTEAETEREFTSQIEDRRDSSIVSSSKAQKRGVRSKQRSIGKKRGQKQKVNPFSPHLSRTISIHYMECDDYVLPEDTSNDREVQETLLSSHKLRPVSSKYMPLSPKPAKEINKGKRCDTCGTLSSEDKYFGDNQLCVLGYKLVENHVILLEKIREVKNKLLEHQTTSVKDFSRDIAFFHQKEFLETLELLNINRELLQNLLHEQKIAANGFGYSQEQNISRARRMLNKSGSFPVAGFSGRTTCRSDETALSGKRESKSRIENSEAFSTTGSTETDKTDVVVATEQVLNIVTVDGTASSSELPLGSPHVTNHPKDVSGSVYRFKDIKQQVKEIIKKKKEERYRISMDGVLHKVPYGSKASQEKHGDLEVSSAIRSLGDKSKISLSSCGSGSAFRRSQSLTESLDRYTYLLEFNFSREPQKQASEGLKLTPGDAGFQTSKNQRNIGRMLSLPDFDSYFLGKYEEHDPSKDLPVHGNGAAHIEIDDQKTPNIVASSPGHTKEMDACSEQLDTEEIVSAHLNDEACLSHVECSDEPAKPCLVTVPDLYLLEDPVRDTRKIASTFLQDLGSVAHVGHCDSPSKRFVATVSDLSFPEGPDSPADFPSLPGSPGSKPSQIHFEEPESLNSSGNQSDMIDFGVTRAETGNSDAGNLGMGLDLGSPYFQNEDTHEFHFLREMLKEYKSSDKEHSAGLHRPYNRLSCSIFEEVQCSNYDPELGSTDYGTSLDRDLLLDLTNEVMLEVYKTSFGHCPWLSHSCYIRFGPIFMGSQFLEEVRARMSWHLKSQPHADPPQDGVSEDLRRDERWMNRHQDVEDVGLDVEASLFDDLLDEAIFECLGFPGQL